MKNQELVSLIEIEESNDKDWKPEYVSDLIENVDYVYHDKKSSNRIFIISFLILIIVIITVIRARSDHILKIIFISMPIITSIVACYLGKSNKIGIGKKIMKKNINRVQLDMSDEALKFLANIKEKTDSSTRAEVIKNAIVYYDILVDHVLNKDDIVIRSKDGVETKLALPLMIRK